MHLKGRCFQILVQWVSRCRAVPTVSGDPWMVDTIRLSVNTPESTSVCMRVDTTSSTGETCQWTAFVMRADRIMRSAHEVLSMSCRLHVLAPMSTRRLCATPHYINSGESEDRVRVRTNWVVRCKTRLPDTLLWTLTPAARTHHEIVAMC